MKVDNYFFAVAEEGTVVRWYIQCCGSASGIRCFFASRIQDGKKIKIHIRDEHPGSYFRELKNCFWVKKIHKLLNSLMRIRIRDPEFF
jgi:hypothetical protein